VLQAFFQLEMAALFILMWAVKFAGASDLSIEGLATTIHLQSSCKDHQLCVNEFVRARETASDTLDAMAASNFCGANGRCARCSACRMGSMSFDGNCPVHCFSAEHKKAASSTLQQCVFSKHELTVGLCHEGNNPTEVDFGGNAEIQNKTLEHMVYEDSAYGPFLRFIAESLPVKVVIHEVVECSVALRQALAGLSKYDLLMMASNVKSDVQVFTLLEHMRNVSANSAKPLHAAETGYWSNGVYWPSDCVPFVTSAQEWPLTIFLEAEPFARGSVAADVVLDTKFHETMQSPYEIHLEVQCVQ
jgi:hypothetical protein